MGSRGESGGQPELNPERPAQAEPLSAAGAIEQPGQQPTPSPMGGAAGEAAEQSGQVAGAGSAQQQPGQLGSAGGPEQHGQQHSACPVVGIGASAGGIDALHHFFREVPRHSGMAFVVVQHLDPDHPSILKDMLARVTPLSVEQVEDEAKVESDTVYVIPPNTTLTLGEGRLHLQMPEEPRGQRFPIDSFLLSLASDQGENAACVILSGTGSDGTIGLRAIKENGGLTLAQADAEYDGMMRSAVATGLVDFVLPAGAMPAKLADYFQHLGTVVNKKGPDGVRQDTSDYVDQIAALIRARTGNDFTDYKDKTIARRIERRMQVLQIDDVPTFVETLRKNPHEVDLLFQDLLIGVTHFFRDPEAFQAIEQLVIPLLFEGRGASDTIRVWVPGCATGEEAYSIAILLREYQERSQNRAKLQIFATDIDEQALQIARIGLYPEAIAKDVNPGRLARYFLRQDGTYRVVGELREICLFALHNILRDPPFSKLDLLSCRNLLIYLNTDVQDRVLSLFHYAMRDDGFLFLGSSENVTRHARLFAPVEKAHRIFRIRPQSQRTIPEFPLFAVHVHGRRALRQPPPESRAIAVSVRAERQILDRYAPPYVLVTAAGDIVHASARTGKYLELPAGAPQPNVIDMARTALRLDIRAALHKASGSGRPVTQKDVEIASNGGWQKVDVTVQPITDDSGEPLYLVVFQDVAAFRVEGKPGAQESVADVHAANVAQLEHELQDTKERLQTTTEELESANEELKSGNEELSSMNEELQSTNEELETSREELQSINEELQTVNAELNTRLEDLTRSNNDIANLLASTQIATVFLDRDLYIQSFTPSAKDVFRLVDSDIGRRITHVRARFALDTVEEDAERVLRSLGAIERHVTSTESDARFVMRVLPYRTVDNVIDGVVLTFIDVTRMTAAEAHIGQLTRDLRNRVESLETVLDLLPVGILMIESDDDELIKVNRCGAQLLGEPADFRGLKQIASRHRLLQDKREIPHAERPLWTAVRTGQPVLGYEARLIRPDGSAVDVMESAMPLFDENGAPRGGIAAVVDISERKRIEHHQQVLVHELQHRVKNILATVSSLPARMARNTPSVEEFVTAFQERLGAMGRMHDILSQRRWMGADLKTLIDAAASPYASVVGSNFEVSGPEVLLTPDAAPALGMVLHELATNAAKYGALASSEGQLRVSWTIDGEAGLERLKLAWEERNPSAINQPDHKGFGSSFIRRSVEYELDGTVEMAFAPQGLRCAISFPLPRNAVLTPDLSGGGGAPWSRTDKP